MILGEFWEKAVLVAFEFSGSITSGLRSAKRNAQVGGKPLSWHLAGLACDVVLDDMSAENRARFIERAKRMFPFVLDEGSHIHLQGER